jgi:hypothetical protein
LPLDRLRLRAPPAAQLNGRRPEAQPLVFVADGDPASHPEAWAAPGHGAGLVRWATGRSRYFAGGVGFPGAACQDSADAAAARR